MNFEQAEYSSSVNPTWKGNPYIEALRPLPDEEDIIKAFRTDPPIPKHLSEMSKRERKHCVSSLLLGFYPLNVHYELMESIQDLIRLGYVGRNPLKGEDLEAIRAFERNPVLNNTACALTLIGVSGMGKTTSVDRALKYFNQVIVHREYHGIKMIRKQIVWLRVQCPYHQSIKGFCKMVLGAFDEILETDYHVQYSSGSVMNMLLTIKKLVEIYGVGAICIDELQHLVGRNNNSEDLNNVLTTFSNMIKVPLIVIGTPKASPIFEKSLRTTRRYMSEGAFYWDRILSADDPVWKEWFTWLFNFQYTINKTPLTEELSDLFYDKCQGIIAVACTLFRKVQSYIITNPLDEKEFITKDIVNQVYDYYFKPIIPIINAVRHNDYRRMEELEDLLFEIEEDGINVLNFQDSNSRYNKEEKETASHSESEYLETVLYEFFLEENLPVQDLNLKELIHTVLCTSPNLSLEEAKIQIYQEILKRFLKKSDSSLEESNTFYPDEYLGEYDEF